jgi:hypothetical protein
MAESIDTSRLGFACLSLVEPSPGRAADYHRWYDGEHFIDGALSLPRFFAGRRWIATPSLRDSRRPGTSRSIAPIDAGSFLNTYWITPGSVDELCDVVAAAMATSTGTALRRMVWTDFHRHVVSVVGGDVPDTHALLYPCRGVAPELVLVDDDVALARLTDEVLPGRVDDGVAAMSIVFAPLTTPPLAVAPAVELGGRGLVSVLSFTDEDPAPAGPRRSPSDTSLPGIEVDFFGAFVPTVPGTDALLDHLS